MRSVTLFIEWLTGCWVSYISLHLVPTLRRRNVSANCSQAGAWEQGLVSGPQKHFQGISRRDRMKSLFILCKRKLVGHEPGFQEFLRQPVLEDLRHHIPCGPDAPADDAVDRDPRKDHLFRKINRHGAAG